MSLYAVEIVHNPSGTLVYRIDLIGARSESEAIATVLSRASSEGLACWCSGNVWLIAEDRL